MKKLNVKNRQGQKGFTLVELAVVMIIVGLLIGGILKGQELISNAQIASTVTQAKGIDAAVSTFRDSFRAFPGDMTAPTTRLSNCTGPCAGVAGAGDGRLNTAPSAAAAGDVLQFFGQLSAADLVTGVDGSATAEWGEALPSASVGGGYTAGYHGTGTLGINTSPTSGHYLSLRGDPAAMGTAGTALLNGSQAARIDRKMDDGNPVTGSVFGGVAACQSTANTSAYDEASGQANCDVFIRIQG